MGALLGSALTMCKPTWSTWSHSSSVPVSRSLQVLLPASQPTESAAGGEPCGGPAISLHSRHVSLVQCTTCLLPITRDPGSKPRGGTYVKPGFLMLALSRYTTTFLQYAICASGCTLAAVDGHTVKGICMLICLLNYICVDHWSIRSIPSWW